MFGFTSMLINVLRDEQPTHIAVAFDVSRKSFRTEQYKGLQGRSGPRRPASFAGQISVDQGNPQRAAHPVRRGARATRPTT